MGQRCGYIRSWNSVDTQTSLPYVVSEGPDEGLSCPAGTETDPGAVRHQLQGPFDDRHDGLPRSCSRAAATTCSGVKPNFFCSSFSGAEAPNVFMPSARPPVPTYRSQPKVDATSTDTRAVTADGRTLSR